WFTARLDLPFEEPPERAMYGRWQLDGRVLRLSDLKLERMSGPSRMDAPMSLDGSSLALAVSATETLRLKRWNWSPGPTPAGAVMVSYDQVVAGAGQLTITPAKTKARPGERIPVRITLTNTDTRTYLVPVRLGERVHPSVEDMAPAPHVITITE